PTHAAQFIQDLDNLCGRIATTHSFPPPWTRIDMALAFISGPETLTWRRSPRLASPIASTLDLKPVDELPPTHPVSAPARAGDLVIPVHGANNAATVPSPVAPSTLVPDVDGVIDLTGSTSTTCGGRPITAPVNHNHEGTLIAPHVPTLTPAVPALIDSDAHAADGIAPKRKLNQGHDADDAETRPSKRIRAQLARRSVPLPRRLDTYEDDQSLHPRRWTTRPADLIPRPVTRFHPAEGVKTLDTSGWPQRLEPPADTQTNIFPRHASNDHASPTTRGTDPRRTRAQTQRARTYPNRAACLAARQHLVNYSSRRTHEVAPATPQPVSQRRRRANAAHTDPHVVQQNCDLRGQNRPNTPIPTVPARAQPPSHSPRDLDKPAAEPPDALANNYDAVTQHLDRWLWRDPDRCYLSHPFHHPPRRSASRDDWTPQSKNTKTEGHDCK
ncbi:hypothetical protein EDB84DRAFT_1540345, partial [Lactarius hengduanensis]